MSLRSNDNIDLIQVRVDAISPTIVKSHDTNN